VKRAVLLPHAFIETVVEIEIFHMLESSWPREQLLTCSMCESIERISKNTSTFDRVAPLRAHMHVEITVVGGFLDGGVEIEFVRRAVRANLRSAAAHLMLRMPSSTLRRDP